MADLIASLVKAVTAAIVAAAIASVLKFVRLLMSHRGKITELQKQGLVSFHTLHSLNITDRQTHSRSPLTTASSLAICSPPKQPSTRSLPARTQIMSLLSSGRPLLMAHSTSTHGP